MLREPARPRYVALGAARLSDAVSAASWARTRDPLEWSVAVDPSLRATLAWVLKDREVAWAPVSGSLSEQAAIVPHTTAVEFNGGAYRGQSHVVAGLWEPIFDSSHAFLRWYLQRSPPDPRYAPAVSNADLYISMEPDFSEVD
jgi:hypothetical protein